MVLLAAVATEESGVEARLLVIGVKALAVEGDKPLPGTTQRRIDTAGACNEAMQLESEERAIADAAALMGRPARQHQECLQLRTAAGLVAAGLLGQTLGGGSESSRLAS